MRRPPNKSVALSLAAGAALAGGFVMRRARRQTTAVVVPSTPALLPGEPLYVTRHPAGRLALHWPLTAERATVFAATDPALLPVTELAQLSGTAGAIFVDPFPDRRSYFGVTFDRPGAAAALHIAAERTLPLASVVNFRDIGGYLTSDGRRVRWGRVYRAGALDRLSPVEAAYLQNLGVRLVCDLRTSEEIDRRPDQEFAGMTHWPNPLYEDDSRRALRRLIFERRRLGVLLRTAYTQTMIDAAAPIHGAILSRLTDPANLPFLVHCAIGKDRTGIVIALLLAALGVPEQTIVYDYALSNAAFAAIKELARAQVQPLGVFGVRVDQLAPILVADPEYISAALAHLRLTYGSVETYLTEKAGMTRADLERLRANLLEPVEHSDG